MIRVDEAAIEAAAGPEVTAAAREDLRRGLVRRAEAGYGGINGEIGSDQAGTWQVHQLSHGNPLHLANKKAKERFISYSSTASGTPDLYGRAGWDHREQAQALATYFTNHATTRDELTPLLAGLPELQPWLDQWHEEFDGDWRGEAARAFREMLAHDFRAKMENAQRSFSEAATTLTDQASYMKTRQAQAAKLEAKAQQYAATLRESR